MSVSIKQVENFVKNYFLKCANKNHLALLKFNSHLKEDVYSEIIVKAIIHEQYDEESFKSLMLNFLERETKYYSDKKNWYAVHETC